jgi:hypothetical protein
MPVVFPVGYAISSGYGARRLPMKRLTLFLFASTMLAAAESQSAFLYDRQPEFGEVLH